MSRSRRKQAENNPGFHILGRVDGRTRVWKFRHTSFYAERGLIRVIDEKTGEYRPWPIRDFILILESYQQIRNRLPRNTPAEIEEWHEYQSSIEGGIECVKLAKKQGDPFDPNVPKQMAWDNRYVGGIVDVDIPSSEKKLILPPDYNANDK